MPFPLAPSLKSKVQLSQSDSITENGIDYILIGAYTGNISNRITRHGTAPLS